MIEIEQIKDRDKVSGIFLVQQKQIPLNKNGKPYIAMVLMNRTGTLNARAWDNVEQLSTRFETGDFVEIRAIAVEYQQKIQLKVDWLERKDLDEVNSKDYLPASARDSKEMLSQVSHLINTVNSPPLRKFLRNWLEDDAFRECFINSPAAKSIHHAYLSGLLEHTLSVMQLADKLAEIYTHLDRDLMITGAFLHDIGKTHELEHERSFEYTDEGRLVGHIVMGAVMFNQRAKNHPGLGQETVLKLTHMILSHHGSLEFGSPKRPKFSEALALNYLDELDAKLQIFKEISEQEQGHKWSSYHRIFDRYLLLGQPEVSSLNKSNPCLHKTAKTDSSSTTAKALDLFSKHRPGSET